MIELIEQDPGNEKMILTENTAAELSQNVSLIGTYLVQMAHMMARMNQRMDEMEAREQMITISHQQMLDLMALIRMRARMLCEKYGLDDNDERVIKNAIKREMLQKSNIKDFHDLPAVALPTVRKNVDKWVNIRIIMQRRQLHQDSGP